jgi:hypothetical protein
MHVVDRGANDRHLPLRGELEELPCPSCENGGTQSQKFAGNRREKFSKKKNSTARNTGRNTR